MSITKTLLVTATAILASAAVLATSIEATMGAICERDDYAYEGGRFAFVETEGDTFILQTWPSQITGMTEAVEYMADDWSASYSPSMKGRVHNLEAPAALWSPFDRLTILNLLPQNAISAGEEFEGRFGKSVVLSDHTLSEGEGFVRTIEVENFSHEFPQQGLKRTYVITWSASDMSDRTLKRVSGSSPNKSEIVWTNFRPISSEVAEAVETKGIPLGTDVFDLRGEDQVIYEWTGSPQNIQVENKSSLLWLGMLGIALVPVGFAVKRFAK